MNVMLVDDELTILRGLAKLIDWEALGLTHALSATNAEQALLRMRRDPVDILVTDINMEGMSGLDLLRELNAQGLLNGRVAIVLSGYREFKYAQEAIKNNVLYYLTKPVSRKELHEVLEKAKQRVLAQTAERAAPQPAQGSDAVAQAILYIDNNLKRDLSLHAIAARVYMSPNYLCAAFKRQTGENFHDYVQRKRMEYAYTLMKGNHFKVYEVAAQAGFKNPRYFAEAFKKYHGISPSEVSAS